MNAVAEEVSASAASPRGATRSTSTRSARTSTTCSSSCGMLKVRAPTAFDRIQYIEQPTARDLKAHPENMMHEAAKFKPVVIDESLIDLESLHLAREMGYTGVALKACKGQTRHAAAGGRGAEVRHVPVRAGPDVPGGVADPLGRSRGPRPRRRGHRGELAGSTARPRTRRGTRDSRACSQSAMGR